MFLCFLFKKTELIVEAMLNSRIIWYLAETSRTIVNIVLYNIHRCVFNFIKIKCTWGLKELLWRKFLNCICLATFLISEAPNWFFLWLFPQRVTKKQKKKLVFASPIWNFAKHKQIRNSPVDIGLFAVKLTYSTYK